MQACEIATLRPNLSGLLFTAFEDSGSSSIVPTTDLDNTDLSEQPIITHHEKLDSKIGTPSAYSSVLSQNKVIIYI